MKSQKKDIIKHTILVLYKQFTMINTTINYFAYVNKCYNNDYLGHSNIFVTINYLIGLSICFSKID